MDVTRIVLPVLASVLALTAACLYLVWICRLRGKATSLFRMIRNNNTNRRY